jgi:hypothetical protein
MGRTLRSLAFGFSAAVLTVATFGCGDGSVEIRTKNNPSVDKVVVKPVVVEKTVVVEKPVVVEKAPVTRETTKTETTIPGVGTTTTETNKVSR